MNRRKMIGTMGLGAAALAATGTVRAQQREEHEHEHGEGHEDHLAVIANCAKVCNETAHHCLEQTVHSENASEREGHAHVHEATMDCQAFCVMTAALMARHSPMALHAHAACAEAVPECAKTCQESGIKSDVVQNCEEACKECEKACRSMVSQHGSHDHHDDKDDND